MDGQSVFYWRHTWTNWSFFAHGCVSTLKIRKRHHVAIANSQSKPSSPCHSSTGTTPSLPPPFPPQPNVPIKVCFQSIGCRAAAVIWFKPKVGPFDWYSIGKNLEHMHWLCQSDSTLGYAHIFILSDLNGILPLIGENTTVNFTLHLVLPTLNFFPCVCFALI